MVLRLPMVVPTQETAECTGHTGHRDDHDHGDDPAPMRSMGEIVDLGL